VLFAYDYLDHFIHKDAKYVNLILALIFILLGLKLLKSKDLELQDEFFHPMVSAYFIGISNMGTTFIYLTIFTYFPVKLGIDNFTYSIKILLSIFLGACIFWFFTCEAVSRWKNKFKLHHFVLIDKIIGGVICTFGFVNLFTFILNIARSN
jgi:ABC-type Fe3+-siderophore transport system permease subunit